ncbi:MAG: OmcA/MtrC family decaheme c-type cytochrome [Bryobacteraceae bacterium]|jgi:OmcA/MtrC family decaheme c-type cytochrome
MPVPFSFRAAIRLGLALALVVGSAILLSSSDKQAFTAMDRAFYADANAINFVRPGLVVKIKSASVADDGTISARFTLADPQGLPLDRDGITTPGPISTHFVASWIPNNQRQYISYITRSVTSPTTNHTATQATSDSGGTFTKNTDGDYTYTFKSKAPASFDKTATHSIGMWAARDLSEFDMTAIANYDSDVFNFVPNGAAVTKTRDVIRTQTCNKCHDPLSAHDNRQGLELCILCHNPQSGDPYTDNSIDMAVMVHKIHAGSSLPSVKAGGKYQIIGHNNAVADFSTVVFPADIRRCSFCHESTTGAAQANAWLTNPNRAACGSCHDDVSFATGQNHVSLPEISDNECSQCHTPQGELEFDASIMGAHTIPEFSTQLPGTVFAITDVRDGVAGRKPTVTFTVKDKSGNPITNITNMRLSLVLAGPTTDYSTNPSESATKATGSGGTYTYTFTNSIPATAKGTYAVGIEGYQTVTINAGTVNATSVRDAGINKVFYFSVDGSKLAPRRQVVSLDKCDSCHAFLSLHGGNRNQIEQCVLCHNPNATDVGNRPASQAPSQTIQLAYMVHRIHTGENSPREYTIYGFGGSANDFTDVRYPGDRRNCNACHVNGSEQVPLPDGLLDVTSPRGLLNPVKPTTNACTGCHTDIPTASHALSNTTTQLGEACAVCHSASSDFGVSRVHAR